MPTMQPGSVTREISADDKARLYAETDARFALQTGITRKLDPKNPLDQKWVAAWGDLYGKILRQYKDGTLAWTYDHPSIAQSISDASLAAQNLASHLTDLATAPADAKAAAAKAAGVAHAASDAASGKGAAAQATIEAAKTAAALEAGASRGARHGEGVVSPAAVISADLVRRAARELAESVARGERVIFGPADAVTALQAQGAPARADAVNTIATGQAPATTTPTSTPHGGGGGGSKSGSKIWPYALAGAAGLGLVAILASTSKGGRARRSRRQQSATTLQIRAAR